MTAIRVAHAFQVKTVHMGRLDKGSDIIRTLEAYCAEKGIRAAWINILGALDKATISYYDQVSHEYHHQALSGEYEIISCSGNISLKDDQPFAHLHIVLSGADYQAIGGHLWPDTVSVFAAEFILFELEGAAGSSALIRCPDLETGLSLW